MRHRVLPPAVIEQACHTLRERGCAVTVVLLEGEDIPLPEKIRPVRLPRSFQNLVAVMRESDLVITADSLPAHLGEYLQIPQFTFIPTPKDYMLPQFAYEAKGWTTFDQTPYFSRWLDAALPTL
jgi:ADP-heptose:LPS heptosyltransferase